MAYIFPVSGTMILVVLVVIAALAWSAAEWLLANSAIVTTVAMIVALGTAIYHTYKRAKKGVNTILALVFSLISEVSSMVYLLLCLWQTVDYLVEDSLFGLIPVIFTAPFTFGAWGIIKVPSVIATSDATNTTAVCDGVITLAMVSLLVWLFKLRQYAQYF